MPFDMNKPRKEEATKKRKKLKKRLWWDDSGNMAWCSKGSVGGQECNICQGLCQAGRARGQRKGNLYDVAKEVVELLCMMFNKRWCLF